MDSLSYWYPGLSYCYSLCILFIVLGEHRFPIYTSNDSYRIPARCRNCTSFQYSSEVDSNSWNWNDKHSKTSIVRGSKAWIGLQLSGWKEDHWRRDKIQRSRDEILQESKACTHGLEFPYWKGNEGFCSWPHWLWKILHVLAHSGLPTAVPRRYYNWWPQYQDIQS